jgi:hypothetical protein
MAIVRAQVKIQSVAGMPKDVVMNRFHFATPGSTVLATEITEIQTRVIAFYEGLNSLGRRLSARWPQQVAATGHIVELYDMADPAPRQPISTTTFNVATVPSNTGLPDEVACVLSFQALKISGIPQARRRNRIYFGPLRTSDATLQNSEVRPIGGLLEDLTKSAKEFLDTATLGILWVVRSETYGSWAEVANGWADNAFDTQRRRGTAPTARTIF